MKVMLKLVVTFLISANLFVSDLKAGAEEHLSQYGVTMQVAREFIMGNVNNPSYVYQVCSDYGVNNDMIAEIVADDFPGLTGEGVSGFFTLHGLNGNGLGFNNITWSIKEGTQYEGNTIIHDAVNDEYNYTTNKKAGEKSRADLRSENFKFERIDVKVEPLTFNDNSLISFINFDWVPILSDDEAQKLGFATSNTYLMATISIRKDNISAWIGIGEDDTNNFVLLNSSYLQEISEENNNINQKFDLSIQRLSEKSYLMVVENNTSGQTITQTITIPDDYSITTSMENSKAISIRGEIRDNDSENPANDEHLTFKSSSFEYQ